MIAGRGKSYSNFDATPVLGLGRSIPQALIMAIFWRNVALLVTLGVAVVVLFPLGSGPFTVTNGPASALRAFAYAALVFVLLSTLLAVRMDRPESHLRQDNSFIAVTLPDCAIPLPLRC